MQTYAFAEFTSLIGNTLVDNSLGRITPAEVTHQAYHVNYAVLSSYQSWSLDECKTALMSFGDFLMYQQCVALGERILLAECHGLKETLSPSQWTQAVNRLTQVERPRTVAAMTTVLARIRGEYPVIVDARDAVLSQ